MNKCLDCWSCHQMGEPSDCVRCSREHSTLHWDSSVYEAFTQYTKDNPGFSTLTPLGWFAAGMKWALSKSEANP